MANALAQFHEEDGTGRELKTLDCLTAAELDAKLQHSYVHSLTTECRIFDDVFDEIEESCRRLKNH